MNSKSIQTLTENANAASEFLKALAHPIRLMTVCFIIDTEKSVNEMMDHLGVSQSNLSQHLSKLRALGILKTRKEANQVYYSIADRRMVKIIQSLHEYFC